MTPIDPSLSPPGPTPTKPDRRPAPPARPDTDPERQPDPSRKPQPAPERPSPRPGREPHPVTDPRNYLERLSAEYYHTLSPSLKDLLSDAVPFALPGCDLATGVLDEKISRAREDTFQRWSEKSKPYPERATHRELLEKQKGLEQEIKLVIHNYLHEVMGGLYPSVEKNLDLQWKDPYDLSQPEEQKFAESARFERTKELPQMENEELEYTKSTIRRSELYYQLLQGFGILYMDGFFRMMRSDLKRIGSELDLLYERYHLNGHNTHHRVFYDVMTGRTLPPGIDQKMEENKSEGRVWHTTDPVVDESSGNVMDIHTRAHARSPVGVVLVHEALKGAFQLLTPWARLNENYLNQNEMNLLRTALNSYWAEIRQFVMGSSFFTMFQQGLESVGISSSPASSDFYLAVQNFILAEEKHYTRFLHIILNSSEVDEMEALQLRRILLAPLASSPEQLA